MLLEVVEVVQAEEHGEDKESKIDNSHEIWMAALIIFKHDQALTVLPLAKDLGKVLGVVIDFFLMLIDISLVVFSVGLRIALILLSI